MFRVSRRSALLSLLSVCIFAPALDAQEAVRVRGTIEKVEGPALLVKTRDGDEVKIVTAADTMVTAVVKASLADIKPGTYLGASGMPQADGSQRAIEIHIFPEAMRGTGDGHRPWDLQPQTTMTNANVEQKVTGRDGEVLTVKYRDGEKKLVVTPETVVVAFAPGDKADLVAGTGIFVSAARKRPDGALETSRLTYGKNGIMPPM
jgi:outer membrane lipoprotein SlyB